MTIDINVLREIEAMGEKLQHLSQEEYELQQQKDLVYIEGVSRNVTDKDNYMRLYNSYCRDEK